MVIPRYLANRMSEEPQPPPLRLKSRVPAAESPPIEPAPTPDVAAPGATMPTGEGVARLRIKPRLSADPVAVPAAATPAPSVVPTPPPAPVVLPPRPVVVDPVIPSPPSPEPVVESPSPVVAAAPVEEAPVLDGTKFKLKPKAAPGTAAATDGLPLTPPPVVLAADATASPADAGPAAAPAVPPNFPPPPPPVGKGKRAPTAKRSKVLVPGLAVVVLAAAGFFGYTFYLDSTPPPPVLNRPVAQPKATPPPAQTATPDATSAAGQLVEKAQEALAVRAGNAPELEAVAVATTATISPESTTPPSASATNVAPAATTPVEATPPPPEPEMEPSAGFKRFVLEMRVNGVFQGDPPRALINGRTVRPGEFLDNGLGIVFIGIDAEKKLILMRDANGAHMTRKY